MKPSANQRLVRARIGESTDAGRSLHLAPPEKLRSSRLARNLLYRKARRRSPP